ncbi:MAG TPA: hypothetical protein VM939_10185 [Gemmatimonadaceae bacterium]|nr:hypothetical protein [Gemmatimonadaceae bacterium]
MYARLWIAFSLIFVNGTASAQSAREHITMGDRDYGALNAPGALAHYEQAIAVDADNYEALWKASRSAMDIGSYASDAAKRSALFASAENYARKAVALNHPDAEGHFALARAVGKAALTQSPRGRVKYGAEVQKYALECLRRDSRHAGCMHVMGMWNAEVMRLNSFTRAIARNFLGGRVFGSASWKEAVRYMDEAIAIEPDRIVHRVDAGEIYIDVGDRVKAKAAFEAALRLPSTDVNDKYYKEQARRRLGQ